MRWAYLVGAGVFLLTGVLLRAAYEMAAHEDLGCSACTHPGWKIASFVLLGVGVLCGLAAVRHLRR